MGRRIGARVVDQDQLEGQVAERRGDAAAELVHGVLLVVQGHHHAEQVEPAFLHKRDCKCFANVPSRMDPSIFKAYDVRGVYGEQLDGDDAYRIGRAFARVLSDEEGNPVAELRIGLGPVMRLTAPEMAGRYADGMRDEGADVVDVGMVGTEMLY